jgi:hypothetical protein
MLTRLAVAAAGLALAACATASSSTSEPSNQGGGGDVTVKRTTLVTEKPIVELDGVTIEATPVSIGQMKDHEELVVPTGNNKWAIGAGPCFKLKLDNKNDQVIKLQNAVIKLADNGGNLYDVLGKEAMGNKQAQLITETAAKYNSPAASTRKLIDDVKLRIDETRIFEPKAEILPGFTGVYFLFFDLPKKSQANLEENAAWLQARGPFKLLIFDVVTKTDAAGNATRKTRFEWAMATKTFDETYRDGKLVSSTNK